MTYNDLIELDEDAEMIYLGVASIETEGSSGSGTEYDSDSNPSSSAGEAY